jgi:putative membrane protein
MLKKNPLKLLMGVAALATAFGAASVHAQTAQGTTSTTDQQEQTQPPVTGQQGTGTMGATTPATTTTPSSARLGSADQQFLKDIARGNIAEIETARLAQTKTQNEEVKQYAQQMIDDHTRVLNEVQQIAQAKGVTLPTEMDRKHKSMSERMSAMSGEEFDRAYMKNAGMGDHKKMQQLLSRVEKRAKDPDLKAFAAKTRPAVEQHLHSAQQLHGASTKGEKTEAGK